MEPHGEEIRGAGTPPEDRLSAPPSGARHPVHPYRDARAALLERRDQLSNELRALERQLAGPCPRCDQRRQRRRRLALGALRIIAEAGIVSLVAVALVAPALLHRASARPPAVMVVAPPPPPEPAPMPDRIVDRLATPRPPMEAPDLDRGIRPVARDTWEVDRHFIEAELEQPVDLRGPVRVIPHEAGGRTVGLRIFGVRPDGLLARLGFENGDTITDVNGRDVANPDQALELYAHLRTTNLFAVRLIRRGQPRSFVYRIV